MRTKLLAWMGPLFLCGCAQLWGPLSSDNRDNCIVTPGVCSEAETCSPVLERCVPREDGGADPCAALQCPSDQACDVMAGRCMPIDTVLDLFAVRPRTGPLAGLPMVTLEGRAFTSPAQVRFGDQLSSMTQVTAADRISAVLPPGAAPGPVRVEVSLASGRRVTQDRLFSYALSQLSFAVDPSLDTQTQSAGPLIITDLNNDKKPDLAVAHNTRVSVYFGGTTGLVFKGTTSGSTMSALGGRFAAGRIDGDAFNDLALSDPGQGNVLILLGDGVGRFSGPAITSVGAGLRDLALADVNQDMKLDLLVTKASPDELRVYFGRGDGTFGTTPATTIGVGREPCSLAVGYFDGDSRPDVAIGFCMESGISVYLNTAGGSFSPPRSYSTQVGVANPRRVIAADVNADMLTDLVVSNSDMSMAGYFSVLLGRGDGTFLAPINTAADSPALDIFDVGDVDGDGFADVVFAPSQGMIDGIRILRGDGFGGLQNALKFQGPMALGSNLRSLVVGDVNVDGKADILYTTSSAGVAVLRNTSQ